MYAIVYPDLCTMALRVARPATRSVATTGLVGKSGLKHKEGPGRRLPPEACRWMYQILSAIAALHARSLCHRDVKLGKL